MLWAYSWSSTTIWPVTVATFGLRNVGWKQRLWIEEGLAGFDPTLLQRAGKDLSAATLAD